MNELLVQIECFAGIFACSTNFVESVDPAVFRRLTLKIRFDPLTPAQRRTLLERMTAPGTSPEDLAEVGARLDRIAGLTAGDFAAVSRRARLLGTRLGAGDLLRELVDECRYKVGEGRERAGFSLAGGGGAG